MSQPGPSENHADSHGDRHGVGFDLPKPAEVPQKRLVVVFLLLALTLVVAFVVGFVPRLRQRAALENAAKQAEAALHRVQIITAKPVPNERALALPGTVRPLEETILYSRANGFVRDWKVDIGDKVAQGQVLAEIETPELDQELRQGQAQLAQAQAGIVQAKATKEFSESNLDRYQKLASSGVATQQDLEQRSAQAQVDRASLDVAKAAVGTQRANVSRLAQLKAFSAVVAPFSGVITARMVDRGALIVTGTTSPLFRIAAVDPVRVFIDVPEDVAPTVHAGTPAIVTVREYPGREFHGQVARTAGALDPTARTLSTEVRVPNADGALLAGMYAEARLTLATPHQILELPAGAVLTDSKGTRVLTVAPDSTVHSVPIVIERDLGATVYVAKGISQTDRIVKLASVELADGSRVEVAQ